MVSNYYQVIMIFGADNMFFFVTFPSVFLFWFMGRIFHLCCRLPKCLTAAADTVAKLKNKNN